MTGKLNHLPQEFLSSVDPILEAIKRWIGGGIHSILDESPVRRRRIASISSGPVSVMLIVVNPVHPPRFASVTGIAAVRIKLM